jgi:hypothetical protein
VAQADPENKVREISTPVSIAIHTGGTNADKQLVKPGHEEEDHCHSHCGTQQHPVSGARLQHHRQDVLVDFCVTWLTVIKHRLCFFSYQKS